MSSNYMSPDGLSWTTLDEYFFLLEEILDYKGRINYCA